MRITLIIAMVIASASRAADVRDIRNDREEKALIARYSEFVTAERSSDADKLISVVGAVRKPQTIPPSEGLTVSKAIRTAGGFSEFANPKVGVWRPKEHRYLIVHVFHVLEKRPGAEDPPLEAGDVVIVITRYVE